jgi:hydroxyacylglutathione hydrolase
VNVELFERLVVGPLECNCYLVGDRTARRAIVIDPGGDADELLAALRRHGLEVAAIVATHAHFDHVVAAGRLRAETGAPFVLHPDDLRLLAWMQESGRQWLGVELPPPPEVDRLLAEGDTLDAGQVSLVALHTPGHSPGSISLVGEGAVFSGDALFAGSVGRTDLPGGSEDVLRRAIVEKLFGLDESLAVLPGHGPATTIEEERRSNPFVGRGGLWTPWSD